MSVSSNNSTPPPIFYQDVNLSTLEEGLTDVSKFINRGGAILSCPNDYYISVARFICAAQRIPLWQPQLNTSTGLNNGLNTIYSVNLVYNSTSSGKVYFQIINDDNTVSAPETPVLQQPTNGWGDVFSYYTITTMINTAIATAYTTLKGSIGSLDANPPYMTWDPIGQLFTMNCYPLSQYDQSNGTSDIVQIYFNTEFKPFLLGWSLITETNNTNTPTGQDVLLVLQNENNNTNPLPVDGAPVDPTSTTLLMTQSISAPWCFVALSKIQIISSIPVMAPSLSDVPLPLVGNTFNNQAETVLLDFIVNYSQGGANAFQQPISYAANSDIFSAPQKLFGNSPINSFFIQIRWLNLAGYSFPLQTIGLRNASIKFAFVHKSIIERF